MGRFVDYLNRMRDPLEPESVDHLIGGDVAPDDAPPGFGRVALLLGAARRPDGGLDPAREAATTAAMVSAVRGLSAVSPARRRSLATRMKIGGVACVGAFALTTGLAAANVLPDAAQSVASDVLAKVHVKVPGPNEHAGDHPNIHATDKTKDTNPGSSKVNADTPKGTSGDGGSGASSTAGGPSPTHPDNQGGDISNLAHTTDATGADKGAEISDAASEGKSHAGETKPTSTTEKVKDNSGTSHKPATPPGRTETHP